jgi:hypothetical protein
MPKFKVTPYIIFCWVLFVLVGCQESSESERNRQYLLSIQGQDQSLPGKTPVTLPSLAPATPSAPSVIGGTPRQVKEGFCGDGIINGPTEDCDQGAIQNTDCRDYGGIAGTVRCQQNCLYDISECITPGVDRLIGGIAETCKCTCNNSACRGHCGSLSGLAGQSTCNYTCDNDCICLCEGKLEAHVEDCEFRCECIVDPAGVPQCACNLAECEILSTISPHIASIATARSASPTAGAH